jgi:peptidoglycan/xylan/chitin deacetylase (PgdA/CDA1 family)
VKVALRDDDTCFFTSPADLERVYAEVWDRVPVCLATVPFAIGYQRAGIPESEWRSGRTHPLGANAALVSWLRARIPERRVTIALHGYTHQDFPDGFEFQAGPDLDHRLSEGRAYLEQLLGTPIRVFVPPHNALSKRGLRAVRDAGLNVLGSFLWFHPAQRPWEWRTALNWWRVARFRHATKRTRRDRMVYPWPIQYGRYAEFGCHGLIPSTTLEQLVAGFEEARRAGGDFCLAVHHWEVDARMKDVLLRFLDHAASAREVRFVTVDELFAGAAAAPAARGAAA